MNKNLPWVNLTPFGDVRQLFVLSDEDGVLVGHMSFQEKKKKYLQPFIIIMI